MKHIAVTLAAIVFFLIVNGRYYWEPEIGGFSLPVFLILCIIFIVLAIVLIVQAFGAYRENFSNKHRLVSIGVLAAVLVTAALKPSGLINFERWEGEDLLVAEREGAANCATVFRLKHNGHFKERNMCFGVDEITGNYVLQNDTIYFKNVELGRSSKTMYYKFAVVDTGKRTNKIFGLIRYKDRNDTMGNGLFITKSELYKGK